MASSLPGWVRSNEASVWAETQHARRLSPAERWKETLAACEVLRFYWNIPGYPERVRAAIDPLPESSQRALARLRAQYKKSRA